MVRAKRLKKEATICGGGGGTHRDLGSGKLERHNSKGAERAGKRGPEIILLLSLILYIYLHKWMKPQLVCWSAHVIKLILLILILFLVVYTWNV